MAKILAKIAKSEAVSCQREIVRTSVLQTLHATRSAGPKRLKMAAQGVLRMTSTFRRSKRFVTSFLLQTWVGILARAAMS